MFSLKRLVKFGVALSFIGLLALLGFYVSMRSDLPSVGVLKDIQWQTPMQIFSADGELISQFGEKKRIPLTLEQMPKDLINAILATEDDRFYLHFGVDPIGMGRAVLGQLMGQNKGGASTITMQVARNFFLTPEVNYTRKLREIFLSFHIESLLSKDEILSLYMNKIALGHRSFGFGAAAQVYYGKDVNDLTLAQIAVLAGLPKAPSTINPIRSPRRAKERRSVVLHRMLVSGYITEEQYQEANNAPITGKRHGAEITLDAPYIAEMAHQQMVDMYGKEQAYTGGYKVFTSVTAKLQRAAQLAVKGNLISYDERHGYRGPIKRLRPPTLGSQALNEHSVAEPLTKEEIAETLKRIKTYYTMQAGVVTQVDEQSAQVILKDNVEITLPWQGMSWARAYINDKKQGVAPKTASEILSYADVIFVTKTNDGYRLGQLPDASSALVSLSPDNGAIKAAIGGFSFKQSQFNRVTQARRQVGSNIKPFVYSAALENGFTLASLVNDAPINQWDEQSGVIWRPKNSPATYAGPIRVRLALAQSKNVVAVRLFREVGKRNVVNHLAQFGFDPNDLPKNESLALGSASLTPLEVATGYATFANGGFLIEPFLIDRIEDSFGNIVYQANPKWACEPCTPEYIKSLSEKAVNNNGVASISLTPTIEETLDNVIESPLTVQVEDNEQEILAAPRVISAQNAFLISEALNSVIWGADWRFKPFWQGTGWRARTLKRRDIAGKTGTTNQSKDAWFSGFSRRLATTVWIGFDNPSRDLGKSVYNANLDKNQITGIEAGAKSAQPAWITFMAEALKAYPIENVEQPENILSVRIDKATGKLSNKTDNTSQFEYFEVGSAPREFVENDRSSEILDGVTPDAGDIF